MFKENKTSPEISIVDIAPTGHQVLEHMENPHITRRSSGRAIPASERSRYPAVAGSR